MSGGHAQPAQPTSTAEQLKRNGVAVVAGPPKPKPDVVDIVSSSSSDEEVPSKRQLEATHQLEAELDEARSENVHLQTRNSKLKVQNEELTKAKDAASAAKDNKLTEFAAEVRGPAWLLPVLSDPALPRSHAR